MLAHRLVCQSWNELLLGAHFTAVAVTGSSQVVRLLKYKGGLYITLPNAKRNFSSYKVQTRSGPSALSHERFCGGLSLELLACFQGTDPVHGHDVGHQDALVRSPLQSR